MVRFKKKKDILKESLEVKLTTHHKFMLDTIQLSLDNTKNKIELLDAQITSLCAPFLEEIQLLQTIPGISKITAAILIAEIGVDMSKFLTVQHLASWAGVCPGNNESAGKIRSVRITSRNQHLKPVLIECAWAASHVKDCYLRKKIRITYWSYRKKKSFSRSWS
jgi:transposase